MRRIWRKILLYRAKKQGLQIGDNSVIIDTPRLGSEPFLVSIADNVTVGGNVNFITHDGATRVFRKKPEYSGVIKYGRITINDNCFIGVNSTLLPGVTIGPNSVVAAGSIVNKDVAPNTIVGGNPAKIIGTVEDYAEKSLMQTPDYDKVAYKKDKVVELLRIYPKPW